MDHLRDGIGLRGYGQKDPLIEYKREGYDLFSSMMERVKSDTLDRLFHVQAVRNEEQPSVPTPPPVISRPQPALILNRGEEPVAAQTAVHRSDEKVGRNDPCPCGSGKKYKKCHGA
jgi:preprotein translocase subunit SecA